MPTSRDQNIASYRAKEAVSNALALKNLRLLFSALFSTYYFFYFIIFIKLII
jgi:hypothetical protein